MSTTLIICVTIVVAIGIFALTGVSIFTSMLKFKHEEIKEYRIWCQVMLSQFYSHMDKWIDKMCE